MRVIAVDIGLTGAMARLDSERPGEVNIVDLPTMLAEERNDANRRRLSGYAIAQQVLNWTEPGTRPIVFFENVQARPNHGGSGQQHGNSMQSQGTLMRSRGIVESACECMRAEIHPVYPQTWKRWLNLIGKDKDASRQLAIRMFPVAAQLLARKKDIDRAEALLIAHYGMVLLNGSPAAMLHVEPEEVPF